MLTPYYPYPPISGGRMRTYNLVRQLQKEYDITLVSFGRPEEQTADIAPLEELCEFIAVNRPSSPGLMKAAFLSLTRLKPITMSLYYSAEMVSLLRRLLDERSYAVVHVESFYMMQNLPADIDVPVLLSEPAIEYVAWRRYAGVATPFYIRPGILLESLKMRVVEPRVWAQADRVGAMSEIDAKIIGQAAPGTRVTLAPNAVDIGYFQPDDDHPRDNRSAIYMGDYKYFPNTDAIRYFVGEILPLVRAQRRDFKLVLLGKDPTPDLLALHHDPDSGVEVLGLVDDTRPYLQRAAMFVCPLRSGSGTRYKILESLACGAPVVSTAVGAEGLAVADGEHILIRDSAAGFAEAILSLLDDPDAAAQMGRRGRELVAQHHAWEASAALIGQTYQELMADS